MDEAQSLTEKKSLLNDDPIAQLALLDKYVKINLIRNSSFEGFVHSIDPLSKSVILFVPQTELHEIILIPGRAIIEVLEIPPPSNVTPRIRKLEDIQHDIDLEAHTTEKKAKLIAWLKKNLIPVSEMGDKIVIGNVFIIPPYGLCDICTDNPIVALQIKKLIDAMPNNYESN